MSARPPFAHRGFALSLVVSAARFGFVIEHDGERLHTSGVHFATAIAAERAARLFVDDALAAFEFATQALADA